MAVATRLEADGRWTEETTSPIPEYPRGPAFNPPLNVFECALSPRRAQWVRLRLTGKTSLQVTEVEILGGGPAAPVGLYAVEFTALDCALNPARNSKHKLEVAPP